MERHTTGQVPPHCPNPNCHYFNAFSPHWPYKRKGYYLRRCRPQRIQRFTCLACGRHFSSQSFKTTYYLKRPELLPRIFSMVVGCMGNRQIARALGCSPSTVALHIARLGRHCLLFQARELEQIPELREIAIDGFETFEWSQYYPFHHNVAVDVASGYFLFHTDSPLRRKGRMTAYQKQRRSELEATLGRPDPKAVERGVHALLAALSPARAVRSDDHPAYPRAIRRLTHRPAQTVTSSKARRDNRNPLWEVNLLDLVIRHSTAAHKRETIAFAKRRQASVEKLAILQVWRNYVKKRREKGGWETPAMVVGLAVRPLRIGQVLKRRLFVGHQRLPRVWERYYRREVVTRSLPVNRVHALHYAF